MKAYILCFMATLQALKLKCVNICAITIAIVCLLQPMTTRAQQNIGIGTYAPSKLLSVNGSILVDAGSQNFGTPDSAALLLGSAGTGIFSRKTAGPGQHGISFATQGYVGMMIDATGKIGIGTSNPSEMLHVAGPALISALRVTSNGRIDSRLGVNGPANAAYRLIVYEGATHLNGNMEATGKVGIGGAVNNSYQLAVHDGNSYFGGNIRVANNATVDGQALLNGPVIASGNLIVSQVLNVGKDAIIAENFRVNGRVGIGGPTNASYQLYVNNGHSYFQGNTITTGNGTFQGNLTVSGNTQLQGNVSIQGKGHVRSEGTSPLRIGFQTKPVAFNLIANGQTTVTINLPPFSNNGDAHVHIAQFEPTAGFVHTAKFKWYVYDVSAADNTAKIRIINESNDIAAISGTFHISTIIRN